jgi:hypothetical protein
MVGEGTYMWNQGDLGQDTYTNVSMTGEEGDTSHFLFFFGRENKK